MPRYEQTRGDSLDRSLPRCHRIHQRHRAQSRWRHFNGEPIIVSFVRLRKSEETRLDSNMDVDERNSAV